MGENAIQVQYRTVASYLSDHSTMDLSWCKQLVITAELSKKARTQSLADNTSLQFVIGYEHYKVYSTSIIVLPYYRSELKFA